MKILRWVPVIGIFVPIKYADIYDTVYQYVMGAIFLWWLNVI